MPGSREEGQTEGKGREGVAAQGERGRRHLDTKAKQRATKAQLTKMFMCCWQCKSVRERERWRKREREREGGGNCSVHVCAVINCNSCATFASQS